MKEKEKKNEFGPIGPIKFAEAMKKSLKKDQKLLRALAFNNSSLLNKPISALEKMEYCKKVDKIINREIAKLKKVGK